MRSLTPFAWSTASTPLPTLVRLTRVSMLIRPWKKDLNVRNDSESGIRVVDRKKAFAASSELRCRCGIYYVKAR